jgi:hypothetical protein
MNNVVARGLGKADPAADNSMAAARQLNRGVEMIVSGDELKWQGMRGSETRAAESAVVRQA